MSELKTIWAKLLASPIQVRVAPFILFLGLTFLQGKLGEGSEYWMYLVKTLVGAALVYLIWPWVQEMRWRWSWEALFTGVMVFVLWVGLDGLYPKFMSTAETWNPQAHYAQEPGMAWMFITVRILCGVLIVPPLEEMFYRSFLYRYIATPEFETFPLKQFQAKAFFLAALIFGAVHVEWLPGMLCGMAYQGLVLRKGRLGDAMTAHAITNLLLGLWVVWKGAWHFW